MKKKHPLSPEDIALFRQEVGEVRVLQTDRIAPHPTRSAPQPRQFLANEARVRVDMMSDEYLPQEFETGEELQFSRPGLQHKLLRKLRRGQYRISAELDLHGLNLDAARTALAEFLELCQAEDRRCVCIIHGKGLRSRYNGPVLKQMVNRWLRQRKDVLAFCSAIPRHGGTGAVYVLLRRE